MVHGHASVVQEFPVSLLGFSSSPGWHRVSITTIEGWSEVRTIEEPTKEKGMKRTVSILTAALFVSALAMPAFAQSPAPMASPEASPAMAAPEASPAPMKKHHHMHHHHKKSSSMASPEASPEAPAPAAS